LAVLRWHTCPRLVPAIEPMNVKPSVLVLSHDAREFFRIDRDKVED